MPEDDFEGELEEGGAVFWRGRRETGGRKFGGEV
jgi:hypothetical protein